MKSLRLSARRSPKLLVSVSIDFWIKRGYRMVSSFLFCIKDFTLRAFYVIMSVNKF